MADSPTNRSWLDRSRQAWKLRLGTYLAAASQVLGFFLWVRATGWEVFAGALLARTGSSSAGALLARTGSSGIRPVRPARGRDSQGEVH